LNQLRVPILAGQRPWGEVEVSFSDSAPKTVWSWMTRPEVQMLFVLGVGGFGLCYLYLRRAMQYLDPAAVVPDRVRKAFDTLTEGVVILDQQSRIVLANQAFRQLNPQPDDDLNAKRLDALTWLSPDPQAGSALAAPWTRSLTSSVTVDAVPYTVPQADGSAIRLLLTSAPIADAKGRARGCMVTFDDVTPVHRSNDELRRALAELERSRELIEAKNLELVELATRDSLTGCLNRRAFFEAAEKAFDNANRLQGELCCLMVDIDRFKQFNDLYGHAVGDQVIQVVARALAAGSRPTDIVCRYGGEEFCILLPGTSRAVALDVAERLRSRIELSAQGSMRSTRVEKVTASFGLSTRAAGVRSLQELIEQADQALYQSKAAGRNQVTTFERS
jgi:diguanylate cyclase (GGDEF)-like protein/PAS domain S-box-containing protein